MIPAFRSELRKLFTTRLWWILALVAFLLSALLAFANVWALATQGYITPEGNATPFDQAPVDLQQEAIRGAYLFPTRFVTLLTMTIGVVLMGQEYRHKTITGTFLATPNRWVAIAAKALSLVVIGFGYALVCLLGAVAGGALMAAIKGISANPGADVARPLLMAALMLTCWALIGFGGALLLRNQILALVILLPLTLIGSTALPLILLGFEWSNDLVRFLPSSASVLMTDPAEETFMGIAQAKTLSWWQALLVLLGWAGIFTVPGAIVTDRRDVT